MKQPYLKILTRDQYPFDILFSLFCAKKLPYGDASMGWGGVGWGGGVGCGCGWGWGGGGVKYGTF